MKTNVHVSKDELYLETPEAGPVVHLAARTLEGKRLRGDGPTYLKIGKKVLYKYSDLISWLESHRRTSTSDTGDAA